MRDPVLKVASETGLQLGVHLVHLLCECLRNWAWGMGHGVWGMCMCMCTCACACASHVYVHVYAHGMCRVPAQRRAPPEIALVDACCFEAGLLEAFFALKACLKRSNRLRRCASTSKHYASTQCVQQPHTTRLLRLLARRASRRAAQPRVEVRVEVSVVEVRVVELRVEVRMEVRVVPLPGARAARICAVQRSANV